MFAVLLAVVLSPSVITPPTAPPPPQVPAVGLPRPVHPPQNVRPWVEPIRKEKDRP